MDEGTSKALFILVGIIIFGIFVVIAYWLFEDKIKGMLEGMMDTTDGVVEQNLGRVSPPAIP